MEIRLDTAPGVAQTEEVFTVTHDDGTSEQMRLHEYGRVYRVPGLYEAVVQDRLACASPRVLAVTLTEELARAGEDPAGLHVLDLGAGNGVVGEELRAHGVTRPLVGLDPEPEAATAAARDRPGLYVRYLTSTLDEAPVDDLVAEHGLTCLAGAGALGQGHTTRAQIEGAWAAFGPGSWLAVTFHEDVLGPEGGELGAFVASLQGGAMGTKVVRLERFRHRLAMSGEDITYAVLVARRVA